LTAPGIWPQEFNRRVTGSGGTPAGLGYSNVTTVGDEKESSPTTNFDGFGGWTYAMYDGTAYTTAGHILTGTFDKDATDVGSLYTDGTNQWQIIYATSGNVLKIGIYNNGSQPTPAASGTLTWVTGGTHHSNIVYTASTNEPISPFWDTKNNKFDFTAWATRNGVASLNMVYVLLSWNSLGEGSTPVTTFTYQNDIQTFLNQLHTDFPSAVVRLVGIEAPSVNGGLGASYGANSGLSQYYNTLVTMNNNNKMLQALADNSSYSSWVKYIGTAAQFDSENNMSQSLTPVNTRNATTENRGTNGVHPATQGYYQIADAVYREFIAWLSSSSN
jgi:hypothetical protein